MSNEIAATRVEVILPERSEDDLSEGMRWLTAKLEDRFDAEGSYGLGGKAGYGFDYENDTFLMKRYCWCDQTTCMWCEGCGCIPEPEHYMDGVRVMDWMEANKSILAPMPHEVAKHGTKKYVEADRVWEASVKERDRRLTTIFPELKHVCDNPWTIDMPRRTQFGPDQRAPNFWHKPSGFRVWWYKYIGRSMETYGEMPHMQTMLKKCFDSATISPADRRLTLTLPKVEKNETVANTTILPS